MENFSPHGENLRKAIKWLSQQRQLSNATRGCLPRELVEHASVKFDLTPLEEEFLLRRFVGQDAPRGG